MGAGHDREPHARVVAGDPRRAAQAAAAVGEADAAGCAGDQEEHRDGCRNVYQAFNGYCAEMKRWVDVAKAGESVETLIPVDAPSTKENAEMPMTRLESIDEMFIAPNEKMLSAPVAADRHP